jgi:hypothetical protein
MTASQYSKGMTHERVRFSSMNGRQLLTRLNRITKTDKLELFIRMAREYQYDRLVSIATQKLEMMRNGGYVLPFNQEPVEQKRVQPTVIEASIIREVELKRPVRKFNFD